MESLIYITDNIEKDASQLVSFLNNNKEKKILLVNLAQENRSVEMQLGIESLIIYNSYDYFKEVCTLEKATYELDDNIHILPSSVKNESIDINLGKLLKDVIDSEEEYETIFIVNEKAHLTNKEGFEEYNFPKKGIVEKLKGLFKGN